MSLITSHVVEGIVMIRLLGSRVSPSASRRLFGEIDRFIQPRACLALDLGRVALFDAAVLALLVRCIRRGESVGASLGIYNLQGSARVVVEMARLNQIVDIYNSEQETVRAFLADIRREPADVDSPVRDGLLARVVSAS